MDIHRATPTDAPLLKEIAVTAKAHWGYPAEWLSKWAEWINVSPAFVEKYQVYKAVENGHILGWCALLINGAEAHLEDLWVRPDRIGTGLGRLLFEYAVNQARAAGATRMDLDADPNAVGFYQHMGMTITGERMAEMDRKIPTMELAL